MTLLQNRGGQIKDGCMIDTYNQQIQYDVSCTIRTNINTANHHFIMEEPKIIKEGNYSPSGHNASSIVNANGISPAVMENHGTVTAVVEPQVLTPKRTEFGKTIRKKYESHEIEMSRHEQMV